MTPSARSTALVAYAAEQASVVRVLDTQAWNELLDAANAEFDSLVELTRHMQNLAVRYSAVRGVAHSSLYEAEATAALARAVGRARVVAGVADKLKRALGLDAAVFLDDLLRHAPADYSWAFRSLKKRSAPYMSILRLIQIRFEDQKHLATAWSGVAKVYYANGTVEGLKPATPIVDLFA